MRVLTLICLLGLATDFARAHDPYEITSVVYVRSNIIELFVEMEFPTGMTLAGQKPVRDVAVLSQFESALPRLRELAGIFFNLTAGNNAVLPLATNVELGVEDHIRFRVDYAPTPYRPLKFVARGLGANASENPYGTSLTVLDMVNQKVLGQATLFAGIPTAEFPPRPSETGEAPTIEAESTAPGVALKPAASATQPVANDAVATLKQAFKPNWLVIGATLAALGLILYAFFRRW